MGSDLAPVHGPARAVNGVTRRLAETGNAARRLGFRAEIDLRAGLADLVSWWRAERLSATEQAQEPTA
jgi:UDP-glucose 4-epimerase